MYFSIKEYFENLQQKIFLFENTFNSNIFIFILIKLGLFKYLFIFKIITLISLIWFLYKKQIKINIVDEAFFLGSIFLIYYNYNTLFSGTDVFNSFGYFSKYLFYNQNLPSVILSINRSE